MGGGPEEEPRQERALSDLVVRKDDTEPDADASAEGGDPKEPTLGDATPAPFGLHLVVQANTECEGVPEGERPREDPEQQATPTSPSLKGMS